MFLISGFRGKVIHFGFELGNGIVRFLCHSKTKNSVGDLKILKSGKVDCSYCLKRYKMIQNRIRKYGVQWVCEGRWVNENERIYKDIFVGE